MLRVWEAHGPSLQPRLPQNWQVVRDTVWGIAGGRVLQHAALVPDGELWLISDYDEPGNALFLSPHQAWDGTLMQFIDAYLKDIAQFFAQSHGAQAFASYDLFNEMDALGETGRDAVYGVRESALDFIVHTYNELSRWHPQPPCTVGWAFMSEYAMLATDQLRNRGVALTYLSSHTYEYDVQEFRRQIQTARNFAMSRGLPYVCSEFWQRGVPSGATYPRPMGPYLDVLVDELVGGQVWGFLAFNTFERALIGGQLRIIPLDGFLTPAPNQFLPLRPRADVITVLDALPWPPGVAIDLTPPGLQDEPAVRRWSRHRAIQRTR